MNAKRFPVLESQQSSDEGRSLIRGEIESRRIHVKEKSGES